MPNSARWHTTAPMTVPLRKADSCTMSKGNGVFAQKLYNRVFQQEISFKNLNYIICLYEYISQNQMLDIFISGVNSFLNHPVKDHEGVFDVVGGLQPLHHDRHHGDHGAQPVEAVKEHLLLDPRHFGSSEEVKEPKTKKQSAISGLAELNPKKVFSWSYQLHFWI